MKKLIVVLAVLAIAIPSMAASITVTGSATGLTGTVGYTGNGTGARPDAARASGFALTLTADNGRTFTAVTPTRTGLSTSTAPGYGIFPGTIVIDANGTVRDYNTPVEKSSTPGAGASGIGTNKIVVALGALYVNDANKPGVSGNLFTFTVSGSCNVTMAVESTYRGGVVAEDSNPMTVSFTGNPIALPPTVTECVKTTAPFYNDWSSFNKPSCWCFARSGRGDADSKASGTAKNGYIYVSANDLNILIAGWNIKEPPYGSGIGAKGWSGYPAICADFDHAKSGTAKNGYLRVTANDLNILTTYWGIKQPPYGSGVPTGVWPLNSPAPGNPIATDPANYNTQY